MKASELRIGNSIYYKISGLLDEPKDRYKIIEMSYYNFKTLSSEEDENYQPIPLTEELLLTFGFESDGIEWWNGVLSLGIYKDGLYYCPTEDIHYRLGKEFKYVHELQNLHFALTGEELTIK
jgi:hypothetical protein